MQVVFLKSDLLIFFYLIHTQMQQACRADPGFGNEGDVCG